MTLVKAGFDPARVTGFEFSGRRFRAEAGVLELEYRLRLESGESIRLVEHFEFGPVASLSAARAAALESAFDLLHWIAGVSYWKLACRGEVGFRAATPSAGQAALLEAVYRDGLAELAWTRGLASRYWPRFAGDEPNGRSCAAALGLARRALVPLGGGKDSLVALERIRALGMDCETVQVGSAPLIGRVAAQTGQGHRVIGRRLDPKLAELNRAGALNGHVPITAINAAALIVAALLGDFDSVVFANERSADTPTLTTADGRAVNHQYAKSFAFEAALAERVHDDIAADLDVFSILRRDRELAVCREFAALTGWHDVFSSCNRNFHIEGARTERWCGQCPKCHFVYLALAPFMTPAALCAIFGADLLDRPENRAGFEALLELDGPRPFECVGEAAEARAALNAVAERSEWKAHRLVGVLNHRLRGLDVPALDTLLEPSGPHCIPERFWR